MMARRKKEWDAVYKEWDKTIGKRAEVNRTWVKEVKGGQEKGGKKTFTS